MVNTVVPFDRLEEETVQWAQEMLALSPMALRMLKGSMNAATDGLAGLQQFAGDATLMFYTTDEAKEGRDAFKEKRKPDFDQFPKLLTKRLFDAFCDLKVTDRISVSKKYTERRKSSSLTS